MIVTIRETALLIELTADDDEALLTVRAALQNAKLPFTANDALPGIYSATIVVDAWRCDPAQKQTLHTIIERQRRFNKQYAEQRADSAHELLTQRLEQMVVQKDMRSIGTDESGVRRYRSTPKGQANRVVTEFSELLEDANKRRRALTPQEINVLCDCVRDFLQIVREEKERRDIVKNKNMLNKILPVVYPFLLWWSYASVERLIQEIHRWINRSFAR